MHTSNSPAAADGSVLALPKGLKTTSTYYKLGFFLSDSKDFYNDKCCRDACIHRHLRATVDTIRKNVFPPKLPLVLTKKGKAKYQSEDLPRDWYCAQVYHYGLGLQPTFNKTTAKKRLAAALESNTLNVPRFMLDLEVGLRQQTAQENQPKKRPHPYLEDDHLDGLGTSDLYDDIGQECSERHEGLTKPVKENKLQGDSGSSANLDPASNYEFSAPDMTTEWGYHDFVLRLALKGSELKMHTSLASQYLPN